MIPMDSVIGRGVGTFSTKRILQKIFVVLIGARRSGYFTNESEIILEQNINLPVFVNNINLDIDADLVGLLNLFKITD